MDGKGRRGGLLAGVFLLLAVMAGKAGAFERAHRASELRGFVRLSAGYIDNPGNAFFYQDQEAVDWSAVGRLMLEHSPSPATGLEAHLVEGVRRVAGDGPLAAPATPSGPARSGLLAWEQHASPNSRAELAVDVLRLRLSAGRGEYSIGRQPVNLATTFYFSPNDFFAPFAAQTFYRVYKPGVDAARADFGVGPLSQLSFIGVLDYGEDTATGNGWRREPDWDRSSALVRYATQAAGFEWAGLAGTVRDTTVVGGSLQGELFDWLGVRAEGHWAVPESDQEESYREWTLGLEHRYPSSLTVRLEQYHHGQGYGSIDEANAALVAGRLAGGYLGRDYSALGLNYELSPLLVGDLLVLANWTDQSRLLAVNAVYSLTDDSELAWGLALPVGQRPAGTRLASEFGAMPVTVSVELRAYF